MPFEGQKVKVSMNHKHSAQNAPQLMN